MEKSGLSNSFLENFKTGLVPKPNGHKNSQRSDLNSLENSENEKEHSVLSLSEDKKKVAEFGEFNRPKVQIALPISNTKHMPAQKGSTLDFNAPVNFSDLKKQADLETLMNKHSNFGEEEQLAKKRNLA